MLIQYIFLINLIYIQGKSKPSYPTEKFQTLADVPSQTPAYVSARLYSLYKNTTTNNNINVLIKWSPIPTNKWNGLPLGYILSVKECADLNNITNQTDHRYVEIKYNKYGKNKYLLKNLKSFECYIIRIAAWNNIGIGPFTLQENGIILNRTSQSRPIRGPLNVNLFLINHTTIRVVWSRLNEKYSNGILIGYKIKYFPDIASSSTLQNNITNLINKTINDFTYYCQYEDKDYKEDNDLNVLLNYNQKEVFLSLNSKNFKDSAYNIILNNLLASVNYKIEIAGCTRAGCGEYSQSVSLKTSEYFPSRPIDLKFNHVNSTSVQIEWKAPRYPNGILKTFRIR